MTEQLDFPSGCLAWDKLGLFGRAQLAQALRGGSRGCFKIEYLPAYVTLNTSQVRRSSVYTFAATV